MFRWRVVPCEVPQKGIVILQDGAGITIPFPDIEAFMKHVFSAATGREFMGAHYTEPRKGASDE